MQDPNNTLFASTDNGVLNFVVKIGNAFLGRRIATIVNGVVTLNDSTPIVIGTGTSNALEISYYTDDSRRTLYSPSDVSLLLKLINATSLATISYNTTDVSVTNTQVNLYQKPFPQYGSMHRQWGQFMYNPLVATGATSIPALGINLLKEDQLTITVAQGEALYNSDRKSVV